MHSRGRGRPALVSWEFFIFRGWISWRFRRYQIPYVSSGLTIITDVRYITVMNVSVTSQLASGLGYWGRWCGFDLSDCPLDLISDRGNIERYIVALCQELDFQRYGSPSMVRFGSRPEIAGISFTQMIETSLISGHMVEATGAVFIDIFSCAEYSPQHAEDLTRRFFRPARCRGPRP